MVLLHGAVAIEKIGYLANRVVHVAVARAGRGPVEGQFDDDG
jgi:hypothetical protein